MMRAATIALCLVPLLGGCDKKKPDGLPPATDWQAPAAGSSVPMPSTGGGGPAAADPHAGVPGAPPIGGGMGADPHAGVPGAPPLGGGGDGSDPHAGVPGAPPIGGGGGGGGGVDVAQMGLPAPDPTRPMDPNKYLAGTIDAPEALRAKIPAGAAIFISVRTRDAATGQGVGAPIAVDKLVASGTWPMTFKLTEAQAMIGGTGFAGSVVVSARFDQDSDAMSKQPGDVTGKAEATIPSAGVKLLLDTTL
ncbi:MAG: hypothetical protein JNK64_20305 [Myxococcales bacterium]|nr:hypothetical protein [Myxococcales bacterium]